MKVIVGKIGSGRTEALIRLAGEHSAYIVVGSMQQAANVMRRAKEMGVQIPFPLTHDEFRRGAYLGRGVERIAVADVDALVQSMARDVQVLAISATSPDAEEDEQFRKQAQEVADGWREEKVRRRMTGTFYLPAGALEVPAEMHDLVDRLSETAFQRQQEEAFRCLGSKTGSEAI